MRTEQLSFEKLVESVAGKAYAFRAVVDLVPAGGPGDKVFPPTYEGSVYAYEERVIDGEKLPCVLLDSVQSQANRLELALLDWHRSTTSGSAPFPLVQIDFGGTKAEDVGILTVLEAPHRIADAFFTACLIDENGKKKKFRHPGDPEESSKFGKIVDEASPGNAAGLFGLCPTALIFGMWNSQGALGGLGEKFQRILTSEIIGINVTKEEENVRPTSRIDPLIKVAGERLPIKKNSDKTWIMSTSSGKSDDKSIERLSKVGLGNVTPSLKDRKAKSGYNHGGVTLEFARQIAVLSLPALRRLRFPLADGKGKTSPEEVNVAARTVLAALALAALSRQWDYGFSLRSRCDLVPKERSTITLLSPDSESRFELTFEQAEKIMKKACEVAKKCGLPWPTEKKEGPWENGILTLRPDDALVDVVVCSRDLAKEQRGE